MYKVFFFYLIFFVTRDSDSDLTFVARDSDSTHIIRDSDSASTLGTVDVDSDSDRGLGLRTRAADSDRGLEVFRTQTQVWVMITRTVNSFP